MVNIEYAYECAYDSLSLIDGSTILGKFCGVSSPFALTSQSQTVTLTFVTDYSGNTGGVSLQWTFVSTGEGKTGSHR